MYADFCLQFRKKIDCWAWLPCEENTTRDVKMGITVYSLETVSFWAHQQRCQRWNAWADMILQRMPLAILMGLKKWGQNKVFRRRYFGWQSDLCESHNRHPPPLPHPCAWLHGLDADKRPCCVCEDLSYTFSKLRGNLLRSLFGAISEKGDSVSQVTVYHTHHYTW